MENSEALKILKILADGVDPTTGEVFERESVYQNPQVIRALVSAISVMERAEARARRAKSLPASAGKPWNEKEGSDLISSFRKGRTLSELAQKHERTLGSIRSRLLNHGIIEPRTDAD